VVQNNKIKKRADNYSSSFPFERRIWHQIHWNEWKANITSIWKSWDFPL